MMFPVRSALRTDWYLLIQSVLLTAGSFRYCWRAVETILISSSFAVSVRPQPTTVGRLLSKILLSSSPYLPRSGEGRQMGLTHSLYSTGLESFSSTMSFIARPIGVFP